MLLASINVRSLITVNADTSNEPEIVQFWNALEPRDIKDKVGHCNPPALLKNALLPILVIVEGRVPVSLKQLRNALSPMVLNGIALRLVMVVRFEQPANPDGSIDIMEGGSVIEVRLEFANVLGKIDMIKVRLD